MPEISSFYTCVPKITVKWCTVLEIQSKTDKIFCHFGLFFALLPCPHSLMILKIKILKKEWKKFLEILLFYTYMWWMKIINEDHLTYGSWIIRCDTEIFVILGHFLPFYPPMDPENQNFGKIKNIPAHIILQMCTINDSHMM